MGLTSLDVLNGLEAKGWLQEDDGGGLYMHPVVREVVRVKFKPDAEKCRHLIVALARKLKGEPTDNPMDKQGWVVFGAEVLRYIDENDADLAGLANNLSTIYQDLGQLEKALEFQEKALSIRQGVLDKNHPHLATSYHNMSTIYLALDKPTTAAEYSRKAIAIHKALFPNGHPDLTVMEENLAIIEKRVFGTLQINTLN